MAARIEDYAIIGDCETAALVARDGYDVENKRPIGNFPQALSHAAVINTAYMLTEQSRHHRHAAGAPGSEAKHLLAANSG